MGNFSKLSPFYVVETGIIILRKLSKDTKLVFICSYPLLTFLSNMLF